MKPIAFVLAGSFAALLLGAPPAGAHTPSTCDTGTLREVETVTETFQTPQHTRIVTKNRHGRREVWAETSSGERTEKSYLVTVELDEMTYTARSAGNFWNFDPTQLIINDAIDVCVDRSQLILRRPDGKDYKARIVRTVRHDASRP